MCTDCASAHMDTCNPHATHSTMRPQGKETNNKYTQTLDDPAGNTNEHRAQPLHAHRQGLTTSQPCHDNRREHGKHTETGQKWLAVPRKKRTHTHTHKKKNTREQRKERSPRYEQQCRKQGTHTHTHRGVKHHDGSGMDERTHRRVGRRWRITPWLTCTHRKRERERVCV